MSDKVTKCFAEICMTNEARAEAAEARVAELETEQKRTFEALVACYDKRSTFVAEICDLYLDKSGALLGKVRDAAALQRETSDGK